MTFRDIGGHGGGCTQQLARETILLYFGQEPPDLIRLGSEAHRFLPHHQIAVRGDAQRLSPET
jgi:hypothetical protein